jgi:predicted MFS family arabinose efflux permease
MITGVSLVEFIAIVIYMKPIDEHLKILTDQNPFRHLFNTIVHPNYILTFVFSTLLVTGGYMLMPFGSAYSVNNLGIPMTQLPILYFVTGIFSMMAGPLIGNLSDVIGNAREGQVWITLQTHQNIIAVASLKDLAAIIIVRGAVPEDDTIEKSNIENIPILVTEMDTFNITGRLFELLKME